VTPEEELLAEDEPLDEGVEAGALSEEELLPDDVLPVEEAELVVGVDWELVVVDVVLAVVAWWVVVLAAAAATVPVSATAPTAMPLVARLARARPRSRRSMPSDWLERRRGPKCGLGLMPMSLDHPRKSALIPP
jgi:hypothetical protein